MIVKVTVLAESVQVRDGVEYVAVTGFEQSEQPLLQMLDYGLREDEKQHKGKLVGKLLTFQIDTIRAIFAGRPQCSGRILKVG